MDIRDRVRGIVAELAGRSDFPDDISLGGCPWQRKGLDLDSLDRIELAMDLEEAFGFEIPDDDVDLPEMNTPAGLVAYVEARLGKERQAA